MDIFPITPATVPSGTPTALLPFTNLSQTIEPLLTSKLGFILDSILLIVINSDPTNSLTCFFQTSEDGVSVDTSIIYTYTIGPGQQATLEIGPDFTRTFYAITAEGAGASCACKWGVRGIMRFPGTYFR